MVVFLGYVFMKVDITFFVLVGSEYFCMTLATETFVGKMMHSVFFSKKLSYFP